MTNCEHQNLMPYENRESLFPDLISCPSWIPNHPDGKNDLTLNLSQDKLILKPNTSVMVSFNLDRDQLPPVVLYSAILSDLQKSTRSCIAQSGVFFDTEPGFWLSLEQIENLNQGQTIQVPGKLRNYGPVSLEYRNEDKIGRLYHINPKDRISGSDLETAVTNGVINGVKGVDYDILYLDNEALAITLKVGNVRNCIPSSDKPIRVSSRSELYAQTQKVTQDSPANTKEHNFHLMETTAEFNLPNQILGSLSYVTLHENVFHLPSHLIDPGSQWIVRLEIDGDIQKNENEDWVIIMLYKSPLCSFNVNGNRHTFDPSLKKQISS